MARLLMQISGELQRRKVDVFPLIPFSVLSVFDDVFFENYDYDIIQPKRRKQLANALKEMGFEQISGRVFSDNKTKIGIPKSAPNLSTSLIEDIDETSKQCDFTLLTPTQAIAWMVFTAKKSQKSESHDLVLNLLKEHPANIEKLRDFARQEGFESWYDANRKELLEARKIGAEKKKFKR